MRVDLRLIEPSPRPLVNRLLYNERNVAVGSWNSRLQLIHSPRELLSFHRSTTRRQQLKMNYDTKSLSYHNEVMGTRLDKPVLILQ